MKTAPHHKLSTIGRALNYAHHRLFQKGIDSAWLDAEVLLTFVLNRPKEYLLTHPELSLNKNQLKKFAKLIDRRTKKEPVAYLMGSKEFYGLKFLVNKNVLIPRPLSETLIDKTLTIINKGKISTSNRRTIICDIGTGSGCLIITLAKKLKELKIIEKFELLAIDISGRALLVARKNAQLHQVAKYIVFLKGDLLNPLKNKPIDLIITNLPYLNETDIAQEPSVRFEPKKALLDKNQYQKLFQQVASLPKKPMMIYENKEGITVK